MVWHKDLDLDAHGSAMVQIIITTGTGCTFIKFSHCITNSKFPQVLFRSIGDHLCIDKDPFRRFLLERIFTKGTIWMIDDTK